MYRRISTYVFPTGHFWEGYTPLERRRFLFHTAIAVACLPFYYLFPFKFGLLTIPYLFFLSIRPQSEYLLPVILHTLYGSQQRFFFVLGCFLYVLFHFKELRKYSLHWLYLFYMLLLPYFIWFFWQKLSMPQNVPGVGNLVGGLFSHFVFAIAFWSALVVKKTGRPFFRGMVIWSFFLLVVMSVIEGGARIDIEGTSEFADRTFFSRLIFWAMPFLSASFIYCLCSKNHGYGLEKILSLLGCFLIVLGFFHLTKCGVSFTLLGLVGMLCRDGDLLLLCGSHLSPCLRFPSAEHSSRQSSLRNMAELTQPKVFITRCR